MTTVETRRIAAGAGDHVVQFYDDDAGLAHTVGGYLADGLHAGGAAIIVAAEEHRRAFAA